MKKLLVIVILALPPSLVQAQEFWSSVSARYRFSETLRLDLEKELRFEDRFHGINNAFVEPSLAISPTPWLTFSPAVRYRYIHPTYLRTHFEANLKPWNKKTFRPAARMRYQRKWEESSYPESHLRSELQLTWHHSGEFEPYVSAEHFYALEKGVLDKLRFTMGAQFEISKSFSGEVFYKLDKEYREEETVNIPIIGFGITVDIDDLLMKSKASESE